MILQRYEEGGKVIKREIQHSCSRQKETAGLATNSQLCQCEVIQGTDRQDTNYTTESHEIYVPDAHPQGQTEPGRT